MDNNFSVFWRTIALPKMFARATFLPSLALNVVLEKFSNRAWWTRIDQHVVLGALPFKGSTSDKLAEEENIHAVISMNEDYELIFANNGDSWKDDYNIKFLQLPTVDIFNAPTQSHLLQGVQFIESFLPRGSVYVHCKAGRTRSATLVACYLMSKNEWTPEQAVEYIKEKRPHILLHTAQWKALQDYYRIHIED